LVIYMPKILKTFCPKCNSNITVEVSDSVISSAKYSPTGIVGVVDIHGDHALVIYVDSNGHERGTRVYTLLSPAISGERKPVIIPLRYLDALSNTLGFRLILKKEDLIIEGFKRRLDILFKCQGLTADIELAIRKITGSVIKWLRAFVRAFDRAGGKFRFDTFYKCMILVDNMIYTNPPGHSDMLLSLLLRSRDIAYRVNIKALKIYSLMPRNIDRYYKAIDSGMLLKYSGRTLYEILADRNVNEVWEILDYILAMKRRDIIEIFEAKG